MHCQLMELFKSKESFKEKVDSVNNWKTAWPRMIVEWHLFFKIIIKICKKAFEFCGKTFKFYPKDVFLFSVFLLNE